MWFKRKGLETDDRWLENLSNTLRFLWAWLLGGFGVLLVCAVSFLVQSPTRVLTLNLTRDRFPYFASVAPTRQTSRPP